LVSSSSGGGISVSRRGVEFIRPGVSFEENRMALPAEGLKTFFWGDSFCLRLPQPVHPGKNLDRGFAVRLAFASDLTPTAGVYFFCTCLLSWFVFCSPVPFSTASSGGPGKDLAQNFINGSCWNILPWWAAGSSPGGSVCSLFTTGFIPSRAGGLFVSF